ncbi:hypothetical protein ACWC24_13225 [Streptomyces sp. NPDC001443]
MFYEDLSTYAYTDGDDTFSDLATGVRFVSFRPAYERLDVGWLEAGPGRKGGAPRDSRTSCWRSWRPSR